jgi:hypothetical protein
MTPILVYIPDHVSPRPSVFPNVQLMSISTLPTMCAGVLLLTGVAAACSTGGDDYRQPISAQDSAATAAEVRASLSGDLAPGAQAYSYRGLFAGISRGQLEGRTFHLERGRAPACQPSGKAGDELTCEYDVLLGPDSASVHVQAVFGAESTSPGGRAAREVTASRGLPLNVDGVRVARQLADAFEKQTALMDRRDAVFGHHQALVRMGTVNGARLNYVDVNVEPRGGREILTVKMSRTGTARPAPTASPARPATSPANKSSPSQKAASRNRG